MASPITIHMWSPGVRIPSTLAHVVAMFATIFRLLDRWRLSKLWWEDAWALLALICDIACLTSIWIQIIPDNPYTLPPKDLKSEWLFSLSVTSVLWFARMSILCSIVRIANPTPKLRWIAYCIGAMFIAMEAGLLAQKIFICVKNFCKFTHPVAVAQLVTDVISDILLVATSVRFLQDMRLPRDRRILIISAFSASLLITGITIFHSVLLFQSSSNLTFTIGNIKAAVALFLCNALVLVMLVYRLYHKSAADLECFMAEGRGNGVRNHGVEFTSAIDLPSKLSSYTLGTIAGSEQDPPHAGKATAFRGVDDSRCRVDEAGAVGNEQPQAS